MQQVAVLDTRTGEVSECQLAHDGSAVEEFYAAWPGPVTVGIESTGYATWFHTLIQRLGHTLLVGDAAKIRAVVVRKTKTDRRDALHLLDLLRHDRFPTVWVPDPATRDLRALLTHRMRLVRIRTMVKNGLHAIALNYRLAGGSKLLRQAGLAQLQALALPPHTARRRDHDGCLGPPRCPAPHHPPRGRGPDGAGHRRCVGPRGPLLRQQARRQL